MTVLCGNISSTMAIIQVSNYEQDLVYLLFQQFKKVIVFYIV